MSFVILCVKLNRREALSKWMCRLGRSATYTSLIKVFLEADQQNYAYFVSNLFATDTKQFCKFIS